MVTPKKRGSSQAKPGIVTTGMGPSHKKYIPRLTHTIALYDSKDMWTWVYYEGKVERAISPRSWKRMADASRSARTFRELLACADYCEITIPVDHKYSGG